MDKIIKTRTGKDDKGNIVEVDRYNEKGNLIYRMHRRNPDAVLIRQVTYDDHDNPIIEHIECDDIDYGYSCDYEYDERGNIIKEIDKDGYITIYSYDKNNKIVSAQTETDPIAYYHYDNKGYLIRIISGRFDIKYENDENGNETHYTNIIINEKGESEIKQEYLNEYDKNNNVLHYKGEDLECWYEYNEAGKLIMEKNIYSDSKESNNIIRYTYNENGELIRRTENCGKRETKNISNYEYEYYE